MVKSTIVKNRKNVYVAINEVITRFSINRNFEKLLENDRRLAEFYKHVFAELDISEYIDPAVSGTAYQYDDLIWFQDQNKDLWLLRSILNDNVNSPSLAIGDLLDGKPNFEKYGWQDQNEHVDLLNSDLLSQLSSDIRRRLLEHEQDELTHRFGQLSMDPASSDYIGSKIMFRDLSNIDENRENYFFPGQIGKFTTDQILDGTYRIWDSGLLEFDIVFRVGYQGRNQFGQDILSCNDVQFRNSPVYAKQLPEYQENMKYFQTNDDMRIFMNDASIQKFESSTVTSVTGNRNKFVNTYFAELNFFPKTIRFRNHVISQFKDLNYMVFGSDQFGQIQNSSNTTAAQPCNCMSWCNKTVQSITAIYMTFPENQTDEGMLDFARRGCLAANCFSCHIIGRWDKTS